MKEKQGRLGNLINSNFLLDVLESACIHIYWCLNEHTIY